MYRPELGTVAKKSWLERLTSDDAASAREFVHSHSHRVADVMTKDVVSAGPRTPLTEIARLLREHRVKRIPIVEDGEVVGIVSRSHLLQGLLAREPGDAPDIDDLKLRKAVLAALDKQGWANSGTANIVSENGVIHLWGYVNNEAVKKAYEVAAANVFWRAPGAQSPADSAGHRAYGRLATHASFALSRAPRPRSGTGRPRGRSSG